MHIFFRFSIRVLFFVLIFSETISAAPTDVFKNKPQWCLLEIRLSEWLIFIKSLTKNSNHYFPN